VEVISVSALEELDPDIRALISDVLGRRAPDLLSLVTTAEDLSKDERERIEVCLADEFGSYPLGPEYEPCDEAKQVDDAIGRFLLRFPFERFR
jgi:hypothetical protein